MRDAVQEGVGRSPIREGGASSAATISCAGWDAVTRPAACPRTSARSVVQASCEERLAVGRLPVHGELTLRRGFDDALRPMDGTAARLDAGPDFSEIRVQLERSVRRACPPWLADQAEDIIQTALIRVMHKLRGEDNRLLSRSYLLKVGYTATIDAIRRARRSKEVAMQDVDVPAEAVSAERRAASVRLGEGIRDCLQGLAQDRRCAVTLYLLGHTVPEIGRTLGWKAKRAENLVYRGLADLRRCLEAKGMKP